MAGRLSLGIAVGAIFLACGGCAQTPPESNLPKPDLTTVHREAVAAYTKQNWVEAEKHYITLTRASPDDAETWFKLGNIYARTKRTDRAIAAYREALIRDTRHVKAWHNLAVSQLREAGKSFSELELLLKPDDPLRAKSERIQQTIDELVN